MCVCCRAGEAVGGQEEERYMGLVDDRKFYNQNLERLGLSVVLGFTPRELKGLREKERETEKGMGEEREVPALFARDNPLLSSFLFRGAGSWSDGEVPSPVCFLWRTMAEEVVCHWLLKLGSAALILHS